MAKPLDIRKLPAQYLVFGGEKFRREDWYFDNVCSRANAKESAKEWRRNGRKARLVPFNHRVFVYVSAAPKKPEKASEKKHFLYVVDRR